MTENLQIAEEQIQLEAPTVSEPEITLEELNKQIALYWKEVDKGKKFDEYKQDWENLNKYRDLKQKLYSK